MKTMLIITVFCLFGFKGPSYAASEPARQATPPPNRENVKKEPAAEEVKKELPAQKPEQGKISSKEREVIEKYYNEPEKEAKESKPQKGKGKGKSKTLPPGLEKRAERGKELPPGWQKKIAPGETMPDEVMKETQPLPKAVAEKLPPPPVGMTNVVVDNKVIRVMEKTRQILDVLDLGKKTPAPAK